jgi:hypothetical protein
MENLQSFFIEESINLSFIISLFQMLIIASIFVSLAGGVASNTIHPRESPTVTISLLTLVNISKLIDEANRCPSPTGSMLCRWNWTRDVEETRIPRVIYKAEKRADSPCDLDPVKECRSENKHFNVLYLTHNPHGVYDLLPRVEEHPVAMSCVDKPIINGEDVDYNGFD